VESDYAWSNKKKVCRVFAMIEFESHSKMKKGNLCLQRLICPLPFRSLERRFSFSKSLTSGLKLPMAAMTIQEESRAFRMSRVLEEVARLSGEVDARVAILKEGLDDLEAMVQMARGFGFDRLKRQFDDFYWKNPKTMGLSNVHLNGIATSVLDAPTVMRCSKPDKVANVLKAVIIWGLHHGESMKYKRLAGEFLDMGIAMVSVFHATQAFEIYTTPGYTIDDMRLAINRLSALHRTFQNDHPRHVNGPPGLPSGLGGEGASPSAAAAETAEAVRASNDDQQGGRSEFQ